MNDKSGLNNGSNIGTIPKKAKTNLFPPGNRLGGRKYGSLNKNTLARRELENIGTEEEIKGIWNNLIKKAQDGDEFSIKMVMERRFPVPKGRHVPRRIIDVDLKNAQDVLDVSAKLISLGAKGECSVEEVGELHSQLTQHMKFYDSIVLQSKIEAIESIIFRAKAGGVESNV